MPALLDDCLACAVDAIAAERLPGEVRSAAAFAEALDAVRTHSPPGWCRSSALVEPVLAKDLEAVRRLDAHDGADARRGSCADVRAQLRELVRPGFVADAGFGRLRDLRPLPARRRSTGSTAPPPT